MSGVTKTSSPTIPPGIPPANPDKPNPSGDGEDDNNQQLVVSSNKKTEQKKDLAKREETLNNIQNWVAAPISALSAVTGTASFLMSNYFDSDNEIFNRATEIISKGAILGNSLLGCPENFVNKNAIGTLGYASDFVVSFVSSHENMYTLRGIGSALDQIPGFLERLKEHPKVQEIYNKDNDKNYNFVNYSSFGDSIEKTFTGMKIVCSDMISDFNKNHASKGFLSAIASPFNNAEKNLLISSFGILSGVGLSFTEKFNKAGSIIRDIFGLHADLAVYHNGASKNNDSKSSDSGANSYKISGALYTVGTVLDLGYRWLETKNLNLFAMGMDRLGAFFMALGNAQDNKKAREKEQELVLAA